MSSKITKKLILYFLSLVLVVSAISGTSFFYLGKKNQEILAQTYAQAKALQVSESLSSMMVHAQTILEENNSGLASQGSQGQGKQEGGKGKNLQASGQARLRGMPGQNFLSWMNRLLGSDIQIVSKDDMFIEGALENPPLNFEDLDAKSQGLVSQALEGSTSSMAYNKDTIRVASPLYGQDKEIIGALVLDEPASLSKDYFASASKILGISFLGGIGLALVLAIFFAKRFLNPIKKIHSATLSLAQGNYETRTHIDRDDELGSLAIGLDTLAQRLGEAKKQSQALDDLKDDFISNMSHELKTPVTVIKSSLEALNSGIISKAEDVQDYHQILYREISFMEKLIQDLMELNILRNKKYSLLDQSLDLIEVLTDALRSQTPLAREKNISIEKSFDDSYLSFKGDYSRLRQMFVTVINNAIKYSPCQGHVWVRQYREAGLTNIKISNYGPSLGEEDLAKIFEPFYRSSSSTEKGFGLGLAISKEIADYHHIQIKVQNQDMLTSFIFSF